jgi:putative tricarboxylic transport membrane protein
MSSAVTRERVCALALLAFAITYGVLAYDIDHALLPDGGRFEPGPLPLALGLIAVLMLLTPGRRRPGPSFLAILRAEWPRLAGILGLMLAYGLALRATGFFVTTASCLILGYLLLGERRWWVVLLGWIPIALAFQLVLGGMLQVAIHNPLLSRLGLLV